MTTFVRFPAAAEALEPRLVFGAGVSSLTIRGDGPVTNIMIAQTGGARSKVSFRNLATTTLVMGQDLNMSSRPNGTFFVTGTVQSVDVQVTGTAGPQGSPGAMSITGRQPLNVSGISSSHAVQSVRLDGAVLGGVNVEIPGASNIRLGDANSATLSFPSVEGQAGPVVFRARELVDSGVSFGPPVRSFTAEAFYTLGAPIVLMAPWVDSIAVHGDFGADLATSGGNPARGGLGVGRASAGRIVSSSWNVAGGVGAVRVGATDSWRINAPAVERVSVAGDFGSSRIAAGSLGSLTVGSFSTSDVLLGDAPAAGVNSLGRLSVRGDMNLGFIRAAGNIGPITAGSVTDTRIYAGVAAERQTSMLPAVGEITTPARIESIRTRAFDNSVVAASEFGRLEFGTVTAAGTTEGGSTGPFGITTTLLERFRGVFSNKSLALREVRTAGEVQQELLSQGVTDADLGVFEFRLPAA